mmetsp:Transcript_60113/g.188761  ORF Transcript_60113/g.188761 Transcript_60113/m.188761 type:complete len:234 (-) Transcript_60113:768-1469(-)
MCASRTALGWSSALLSRRLRMVSFFGSVVQTLPVTASVRMLRSRLTHVAVLAFSARTRVGARKASSLSATACSSVVGKPQITQPCFEQSGSRRRLPRAPSGSLRSSWGISTPLKFLIGLAGRDESSRMGSVVAFLTPGGRLLFAGCWERGLGSPVTLSNGYSAPSTKTAPNLAAKRLACSFEPMPRGPRITTRGGGCGPRERGRVRTRDSSCRKSVSSSSGSSGTGTRLILSS